MGKRLIDLAGAAVGLCAAAPLIALAAVAIKLDSPGPVFFLQTRTGRAGRPFRVIKLRSMHVGARPVIGDETHADDPLITRVGAILRRSGLDELPQLINVLKGDMSLVGPRPLLQWENDRCDARQATRLCVRPGLTGLAQVSGRNRIAWAERMNRDADYVARAGPWLDFKILCKTVAVVLTGRDAYIEDGLADTRRYAPSDTHAPAANRVELKKPQHAPARIRTLTVSSED